MVIEGKARLFIAVPMPVETRLALDERLSGVSIPGKVVPAANWHLTLRFLGWTDQVGYDRVLAALDEAERGASFEIGLGGMGAFPRPTRATVVWLAVTRGNSRLDELAEVVEEAAQTAGFTPEDRPFRPHLTLSRVRPPEDVTLLVGDFPESGIGWRCDSIVVYRSRQGRGGVSYEPLETFPLTR